MLFKQQKPRQYKYRSKNFQLGSSKSSKELELGHSINIKKGEKRTKNRLIFLLLALGMIIVLWFMLGKYET